MLYSCTYTATMGVTELTGQIFDFTFMVAFTYSGLDFVADRLVLNRIRREAHHYRTDWTEWNIVVAHC